MPPDQFFQDKSLIALISDSSIDFTPNNFESPLSNPQQEYLKKHLGIDIPTVFWRKQVHGDDVLEAEKNVNKTCPDADAYITNQRNLTIAIRTADCVPVFIFDPQHRAIGLAHAGWKGTYKKIAAKTVQQMQAKYHSDPKILKVYLGPSIRQCCYQVGEEFRDYFPHNVSDREGKLYADVVGANQDQLRQIGVLKENMKDSEICTHCNNNYFSYRRDAEKAGRMISLMMLI